MLALGTLVFILKQQSHLGLVAKAAPRRSARRSAFGGHAAEVFYGDRGACIISYRPLQSEWAFE